MHQCSRKEFSLIDHLKLQQWAEFLQFWLGLTGVQCRVPELSPCLLKYRFGVCRDQPHNF